MENNYEDYNIKSEGVNISRSQALYFIYLMEEASKIDETVCFDTGIAIECLSGNTDSIKEKIKLS